MLKFSKNFLERFFYGLFLVIFIIVFRKNVKNLMFFLSFLMLFEVFFAIKSAKISFLKSFFLFLLVFFCLLMFVLSVVKGENLLNFILATFILDTSSYIGGNIVKSPKICMISPKKTLAGYIVGLICGTMAYIYLIKVNLIFAILITLISILGDFLFSCLKRELKVKDFSSMIPGHGGVLDRFDSLCLSYILYSILL